MYALFEYKGKQYKAEKDAVIVVDKVSEEKGSLVDVEKVLLVSDGDNIKVGTPYVSGSKVKIEIGDSFKGKKVLVFKYKSKKDYHRFKGHRQQYTKITVKDIVM